jgi:hypothetical protein
MRKFHKYCVTVHDVGRSEFLGFVQRLPALCLHDSLHYSIRVCGVRDGIWKGTEIWLLTIEESFLRQLSREFIFAAVIALIKKMPYGVL